MPATARTGFRKLTPFQLGKLKAQGRWQQVKGIGKKLYGSFLVRKYRNLPKGRRLQESGKRLLAEGTRRVAISERGIRTHAINYPWVVDERNAAIKKSKEARNVVRTQDGLRQKKKSFKNT